MAEYLIAFNDEWVPEHTDSELSAKSRNLRPLLAEMRDAGALIFTGGLDDQSEVYAVEPTGDGTVVAKGEFRESVEHLGGFAVIEAPDDESALHWARRIAEVCGWPQEVRRFRQGLQAP